MIIKELQSLYNTSDRKLICAFILPFIYSFCGFAYFHIAGLLKNACWQKFKCKFIEGKMVYKATVSKSRKAPYLVKVLVLIHTTSRL